MSPLEEANTAHLSELTAVATSENMLCLHVYHRSGAKVVPLYADAPLVIGRATQADLSFPDKTLSRRHAQIELSDGTLWVSDLGSKNGITVNGQPTDKAKLEPGDEVVAGTVKMVVVVRGGATHPRDALETHDGFLRALEDEVLRARMFSRGLAIIVVRSSAGEEDHLSGWCAQVRNLLRPIDRIAVYGGNILELLLPENEHGPMRRLAQHIAQCRTPTGPILFCGVAAFPLAAASAEELLEVALSALKRATTDEPVHDAPSRGTDVFPLVPPTPTHEAGDLHIIYSPSMIDLYAQAERVANSELPVLIYGETGTGKEVLARAIHMKSSRHKKPLRCINCGAIPGPLIESLLFGHERGAFTGAVQRTKGVFEEADGGTVLLDEIAELSPEAQAVLLRVLETKRLTRVGSTQEIDVDVRIMAATHRDLETMATEGSFRWDLYYRLNTLTFRVPPLRDRPEEIVLLAKAFVAAACEVNRQTIKRIEREALNILCRYRWPGNVRELRNVIERAVVIAQEDVITVADWPERVREVKGKRERVQQLTADLDQITSVVAIPPEVRKAIGRVEPEVPAAGPLHFKKAVQAFERRLLLAALQQSGGNRTAAARILDLPVRTLLHKLSSYGITEGVMRAHAAEPRDNILDEQNARSFWSRVQQVERELIERTLAETDGNKTAAARRLNMPLRTLIHKLTGEAEASEGTPGDGD